MGANRARISTSRCIGKRRVTGCGDPREPTRGATSMGSPLLDQVSVAFQSQVRLHLSATM
jgi:hypothetical protein